MQAILLEICLISVGSILLLLVCIIALLLWFLAMCNYVQTMKDKEEDIYKKEIERRREDAILYEDYLEMLNDNPPMMPFDRPAEF